MKIEDAAMLSTRTTRAVLEDMAREGKGAPVRFPSLMLAYRGLNPVAMIVLPPNRETIMSTVRVVAGGFAPDVIALTHDTYAAIGSAGKALIDPRTGKRWGRNPGHGPGPMQTYVEEFGYDGTIADCLVTQVANRAGDVRTEAHPYAIDGRWVRWLEPLDPATSDTMFTDDGVSDILRYVMGLPDIYQTMPNELRALSAIDPERAYAEMDVTTATVLHDGMPAQVQVRLFAKPGSPRHQRLRQKFARSQIVDPSRWN